MRRITDVNELDSILLDTDTVDRKHLPSIKKFLKQDQNYSDSAMFQYSNNPTKGLTGIYTGYGPCHASYIPDEYTDFTANIFTRQVNKKFSKFYLNYILSDESPWKSVLGSSIVLEKDSIPQAILFPDMSVNAHVLTNFLIAGRMAGYWFNAEPFYYLVNHFDFSKTDAFLLSLNFYLISSYPYEKSFGDVTMYSTHPRDKKEKLIKTCLRGWCSSDMPFYYDMEVERFRRGDPIIAQPSTFKDGAKSQPCNQVWGGRRVLPNRENNVFKYQEHPYEEKDVFGFVERKLADPNSPEILKIKDSLKNNKKEIKIAKPTKSKTATK